MTEAFEKNICYEPNTGCWLWIGTINEEGYGKFYRKTKWKTDSAHRISFGFNYGYLPKELDHLCRMRNCVNPQHLESVTHHENVLRGKAGETAAKRQLSKTHCPQGHEYTIKNTYIDPKLYYSGSSRNNPSRHCKICKLEAHKRWRKRQKNEK